jgi:hypothetical protein
MRPCPLFDIEPSSQMMGDPSLATEPIVLDLDELSRLADDVNQQADALDHAADRRDDWSGHSGSEGVDQALSDFFAHWSDRMKRVSGHLATIGRRLDDATEGYSETETSIEREAARRR